MISAHLIMLASAIMVVEGASAHHPHGPMQITPIMLADYNAHVARRQRLTARECKRIGPSQIVFRWYVRQYCEGYTAWQIAACWNAGPDGADQAAMKPNGVIADYAWRVEALYLDAVKRDLKDGEKLLAQK